jgi:hypothetical protein
MGPALRLTRKLKIFQRRIVFKEPDIQLKVPRRITTKAPFGQSFFEAIGLEAAPGKTSKI